jgi:hypothetical protein
MHEEHLPRMFHWTYLDDLGVWALGNLLMDRLARVDERVGVATWNAMQVVCPMSGHVHFLSFFLFLGGLGVGGWRGWLTAAYRQ